MVCTVSSHTNVLSIRPVIEQYKSLGGVVRILGWTEQILNGFSLVINMFNSWNCIELKVEISGVEIIEIYQSYSFLGNNTFSALINFLWGILNETVWILNQLDVNWIMSNDKISFKFLVVSPVGCF